jgi:hypothetical protein
VHLRKALLLVVLALSCRKIDPNVALEAHLQTELARLDAKLKTVEGAKGMPEYFAGLPKTFREGLDRARAAKSPLLRLYRLREPYTGVELLAYFVEQKDAAKDLATFNAHWNAAQPRFTAKKDAIDGPLLYRALAEGAENRAEKYFYASKPYAKSSGPVDGLYYLGEADANLRFRAFIASLPKRDDDEQEPNATRLAALQQAIEAETLTAFQNDPTGTKMIPVSARLKEAREQLDAKKLHGATLSLLEARNGLNKRLEKKPAAVTAQVSGESMPQFLAALTAEEPIASKLQPLYQTLLQPMEAPATKPAAVKVTLVRWPYT